MIAFAFLAGLAVGCIFAAIVAHQVGRDNDRLLADLASARRSMRIMCEQVAERAVHAASARERGRPS